MYATGERAPDRAAFWPLWLFFWAALNGLFLARDVFNLYVALELATLSGVALVGRTGAAPRAAAGYLVAALAGSLAYLPAVVLLYGETGALAFDAVATALELTAAAIAWGSVQALRHARASSCSSPTRRSLRSAISSSSFPARRGVPRRRQPAPHSRLRPDPGPPRRRERLPLSTYAFGAAGISLMGVPPSGGFVAKLALERPLGELAWAWPAALLPLTAAGTALLLGRALVLAARDARTGRPGRRAARGCPGRCSWPPSRRRPGACPPRSSLPGSARTGRRSPVRLRRRGPSPRAWACSSLCGCRHVSAARRPPPLGDLGLPAARLLAVAASAALGALAAELRLSALAVAGALLVAATLMLVALFAAGGSP